MHDAPDPQPQSASHLQPSADVLDTLDAALDALALGTPPSVLAEFDLDPDLTRTIDDLWARASRTGPPAPDAAFVARLREELIPMTPAKPTVAPLSRRSLHVVSPFPRLPRMNSLFGAISTAAAIVLVVVLVLVSFIGDGRGTSVLNGLGLISKQEFVTTSSPVATPDATIPVTMTDDGFTPSKIVLLAGIGPTQTLVIRNDGTKDHSFTLPGLNVDLFVSPGQVVRQTLILRSGVLPYYSRVANDLELGFTGELTVPPGVYGTPYDPSKNIYLHQNQVLTPTQAVSVRARPSTSSSIVVDLTIGSYVEAMSTRPNLPKTPTTVTAEGVSWILVMAEAGTFGWVDASRLVPFFGTPQVVKLLPSPETIAASPEPSSTPSANSLVQVTMTDTGYGSSAIEVAAGSSPTVTFRITNTGMRTHTFTVPDLDISEVVDPGQTVEIMHGVKPGSFAVYSTVRSDAGTGFTAQLTVPEGVNTPSGILSAYAKSSVIGSAYFPVSTVRVHARPATDSAVIASVSSSNEPNGMLLSYSINNPVIERNPTIVTVDGTSWLFVVTSRYEAGWVNMGEVTPYGGAPVPSGTPPVLPTQEVLTPDGTANCPSDVPVPVDAPRGVAILPMPVAGRYDDEGWPAVAPSQFEITWTYVRTDEKTTSELVDATSTLLACARLGDDRVQPLLSTDYRQRRAALPAPSSTFTNPSALLPLPASALSDPPNVRIVSTVILPDGRALVAFNRGGASTDQFLTPDFYYVFTPVGGRWYLDEAVAIAGQGTATFPVPNQPQFETTPVNLTLQVDSSGLLSGDATAIADTKAQLTQRLAPYTGSQSCQIGFVSIAASAGSDDKTKQLGDKIASILRDDFPGLVRPVSQGGNGSLQSLSLPDSKADGTVILSIYFYEGCSSATPAPATP